MLDAITSSSSPADIAIIIFTFLVIMLVAMPLHECAHGWVALLLGDTTAEESGRLTLNPIEHIDPMGALAMLLFGIGWAKPVPVNPARCNKVKPKAAMALIGLAGPLSNLLLAFIVEIIYKVVLYSNAEILLSGKESMYLYLVIALGRIISLNVYLALFNLLPVPPFDGSRLFLAFLPTKLYFKVMRYERIIMIVIMVLLLLGVFSIPLSFLTYYVNMGLDYATGFVEILMGVGV
ncbi:MAG: site-2 protease family protein [Oscillospiraceae bacterium]|nr:site-2 protease family protein [Oscillospiraceae bacterium]